MKYIPADKLIKAIEEKGLDCSFALKMERLDTLALIDKLQQDQPEVDLEKIVSNYLKIHHLHIKDGVRVVFYNGDSPNFMCDIRDIARHFYELGLNARKEECK